MLKYIILCLFILFSFNSFATDSLKDSMYHASSALRAQGERMKIVAQNIANANSTSSVPGGEPYRRKILSFKNKFDKNRGYKVVKVDRIQEDFKNDFRARYQPSHPAANEQGYVLYPNVKTTIERMDMKEAQRGYEANLGVIETSKTMYNKTIDLLR